MRPTYNKITEWKIFNVALPNLHHEEFKHSRRPNPVGNYRTEELSIIDTEREENTKMRTVSNVSVLFPWNQSKHSFSMRRVLIRYYSAMISGDTSFDNGSDWHKNIGYPFMCLGMFHDDFFWNSL